MKPTTHISKEPSQLRRGKEFQKIVQADYKNNSEGEVDLEKTISFQDIPTIKQKRGRMDIVVQNEPGDFNLIMEIKATDWDRIKPKNIKRNLYKKSGFSIAMLYPEPPKTEGLRELIETWAMDKYSFPVY